MSVSCGEGSSVISGLIFFFLFIFLTLCMDLSFTNYFNQVLSLQHLSKSGKMGCCDSRSQPLITLRKRYGILAIDNHFLAKIQVEHLRRRRFDSEALMFQHSERIFKQKLAQINKKQQLVVQKFEQPLRIARSNPQKARQAELRYNMTLQQIIGLEGVRLKFQELKGIMTKNIKQANAEMMDDIKMRFQLMESKLKEKIINVEVMEVKIEELNEVQNEFKKKRAQQIKRGEAQVDQEISKMISFENYTKRFIFVVPQQQLMTLTFSNPESIYQSNHPSNQNVDINPASQNQTICCC